MRVISVITIFVFSFLSSCQAAEESVDFINTEQVPLCELTPIPKFSNPVYSLVDKSLVKLVPLDSQNKALKLMGKSSFKEITDSSKFGITIKDSMNHSYLVRTCLFGDFRAQNQEGFEKYVSTRRLEWNIVEDVDVLYSSHYALGKNPKLSPIVFIVWHNKEITNAVHFATYDE